VSIECPACKRTTGQSVTESRDHKLGTRRRRACPCGHRFTTIEVNADNFESRYSFKASLK
jgi:transcriptional regulator NrdR family protein